LQHNTAVLCAGTKYIVRVELFASVTLFTKYFSIVDDVLICSLELLSDIKDTIEH